MTGYILEKRLAEKFKGNLTGSALQEHQDHSSSKLVIRVASLPLELRQMILVLTITPFRRPEAPLGYLVDPPIMTDFCNQRDEFKQNIVLLKELGPSFAVDNHIESIEKEWRKEWKSMHGRNDHR
jgi:hypothetical protein